MLQINFLGDLKYILFISEMGAHSYSRKYLNFHFPLYTTIRLLMIYIIKNLIYFMEGEVIRMSKDDVLLQTKREVDVIKLNHAKV